MKIVTIHQPDFMPWLGFFNKIKKADAWVVLNHVKNNPRDAAFWCRRVQILVNGSPFWLSLPLEKPKDSNIIGVPINEIKYNINDYNSFKKALQTIEITYRRAPYFYDVFPIVEEFFVSDEIYMSKRNMKLICSLLNALDINTEIIYSDNLNCTSSSTELLIEILKKVDGSKYLCGNGAGSYQIDALFHENHLQLEYNNFTQTKYFQFNSKNKFIPGLSIIDAIMNIGFSGVKEILNPTTMY
jgi:hypothetical protein